MFKTHNVGKLDHGRNSIFACMFFRFEITKVLEGMLN